MIYVIADDLTGSSDTGVQFAKRGYKTVVAITPDNAHPGVSEDMDVYVIDTETRDEETHAAHSKLKRILKGLHIRRHEIVYKKVDSTLRGSIGVEIEELMTHLGRDLCIFTPTLAPYGRITIGGYLVVQGEVLGHSKYYTGKLEPGEASYIPLLLRQQTKLPIARVDLKDVAKGVESISQKLNELYENGAKIVVIDATNETHLHDIFESSLHFEGSIVYAGSAGLAEHIRHEEGFREREPCAIKLSHGPYLVLFASRHPIIQMQIAHLKKQMRCYELVIEVGKIPSNIERMKDLYTEECVGALNDNMHVVIHTDPAGTEEKNTIERVMHEHKIGLRELELQIRQFLGELVSHILYHHKLMNIILSGGDTALGVCNALQIKRLEIIDELLPGIPISRAQFEDRKLQLITKAGGFGEIDTLYRLMDKLKNTREKALNQ
jgi:uncharacterized protein YgbK (DUF1537 family)